MSYGILVIEDEDILARNIKRYLERHDYEVRLTEDGVAGLSLFDEFQPDLILLDLQLPGQNGLEVLRRIRELDQQVIVVMMTAHGNIETAVEAIKAGAHDYLNKPLVLSELKMLIDKALGQERLEEALSYLQTRQASRGGLDAMLGESPAIDALRQRIRQVITAESSLTDQMPAAALITGETGTGKELVARALHFDGPRRDRPFIELNCAAIPEQLVEAELFGYESGAFTDAKGRKIGLVEAALGGTLFLDEVGELALSVQAKLLKLIEDRTVRRLGSVRDRGVNVRIVAATNRPLEQLVEAGAFRSDLYYRLRTLTLTTPPLRDRDGDVLLLARHFLTLHGRRYARGDLQFAESGKQALRSHSWPGNIRELSNVIEQAVLLAADSAIDAAQLSMAPGIHAAETNLGFSPDDGLSWTLPPDGIDLEALEKDMVRQALQRTAGNVTQAANLLNLSRDTLRYRIEKHGLQER